MAGMIVRARALSGGRITALRIQIYHGQQACPNDVSRSGLTFNVGRFTPKSLSTKDYSDLKHMMLKAV